MWPTFRLSSALVMSARFNGLARIWFDIFVLKGRNVFCKLKTQTSKIQFYIMCNSLDLGGANAPFHPSSNWLNYSIIPKVISDDVAKPN
jgi:hypothetical protein